MLWLIIAIISYLILAIVSLVDKYLLTKTPLSPKIYAFYIGLLQILALALIPFIGFYLPQTKEIFLAVFSGASFVLGIFWFFKALHLFEASKVIPAVGGLTPLFSFGLVYLFSLGKASLSITEGLAFILLILGSILINIEKEKLVNFKSLRLSAPSAFFLALSFILIKYVYQFEPFWNGFILRGLGGFLTAICFFVIFPEIRNQIFKKEKSEKTEVVPFSKKIFIIFVLNQTAGAGSAILQNWAIALAPFAFIPFVHAIQGVQYLFVFLLAIFISFKFPQILKEEVSKKIIFQKTFSILLIIVGLILIFLNK